MHTSEPIHYPKLPASTIFSFILFSIFVVHYALVPQKNMNCSNFPSMNIRLKGRAENGKFCMTIRVWVPPKEEGREMIKRLMTHFAAIEKGVSVFQLFLIFFRPTTTYE